MIFFQTAIKLNIVVTVTDVHIENENVSDETKTAWEKWIKPAFGITIVGLCISVAALVFAIRNRKR